MATPSILSRLNPVPAFPSFTGPHKVGTVDVEIPVSQLESPSASPEGISEIHTVQFRIFYPATSDTHGRPIPWLPSPQRLHVAAYAQFLGAGSMLASALSFVPRHLHYASIPVHKNATALRPGEGSSRWPTMIFSHGLGGNRNTYSHLAGSLASHGVVVICPEHRDGSAPVSLVRDPHNQDSSSVRRTRREVHYQSLPHTPNHETWEARDKQIRIRLWELGLIFDAISSIDDNNTSIIQANLNKSTPPTALAQLAGLLDVKQPGRVIFAGHSFGAATMVQLLKTTYYASHPSLASITPPYFLPSATSSIRKQVTSQNPTILLDMWCLPLLSRTGDPLFHLPLPIYAANDPSAPGGKALLAIESDGFFKWKENLELKARVFSPKPSARVVSASDFERPTGGEFPRPSFFYVKNSAHLSQSDFGILFPWLTKRVFGAEQPERCLRLNMRAELQFLRENGYSVPETRREDLVDGGKGRKEGGGEGDRTILDPKGSVDSWGWVEIVGLGKKAGPTELDRLKGTRSEESERRADKEEREMEAEMEPSRVVEGEKGKGAVEGVLEGGNKI